MTDSQFLARLLLPEGTTVRPLVNRPCTVHGRRGQIFSGEPGVVIKAAASIYDELTVRFESGAVISYHAHEVAPVDTECPFDLRGTIVLRTRIGSYVHGIAHEDSDDDFRGVFISPPDLHWSLYHTPRRVEHLRDGLDELYYEVGGFVRRLLTGDPMVIETLFSNQVDYADELGRYLLKRRSEFLTRTAMIGFPIFLRNQIRDLTNRHRRDKRVKPKALMHSLRLAHSALRAVRTGELTLEAREHAADYIAIREGRWPFEHVNQMVHRVLREIEASFEHSPLPVGPATAVADDVLIVARGEFARRYLETHPLPRVAEEDLPPEIEIRSCSEQDRRECKVLLNNGRVRRDGELAEEEGVPLQA